jgi:SNF2 family DNA or RNA helicase
MFHLLDPKLYGSYWKFVGAFYVTLTNHFGGLELIAFKNQESWFDLLRRKATILSKKDVGHQETIRARRFADLDKDQIRLLKEYEEDMYATLPDRLDIVSTSLTQTLRYRQLLCCPKIVDPTLSIGGSLVDLVETFKEEEASPFCVIFVPFTEAFQHFIAYLEANGITNVQTLSGGISPDEQDERISKWRTHGKSPILVSILYAQAFSLEPATEAYFIGYDWDPDNNTQAEERLNRLTTKEAVTAFYYTFEDTYDERQLEIVNTKQRQKNKVMPQK